MNNEINKEKRSTAFYLAIAYIIIEFIRPQSMYQSISNVPLAKICVGLFILFFVMEYKGDLVKNSVNKTLMLFGLSILVSVIFAIDSDIALSVAFDFYKWVLIYFLIINTINSRNRLYIFVIVLLLCYFKLGQFAVRMWIAQGFDFDPYRGMYIGAGFLHNAADLGVGVNTILGTATYMIVADKDRRWWGKFKAKWFHIAVLFSFVVTILVTGSRGAALALGANFVAVLARTKKKILVLPLIALIGIGFWLATPEIGKERFHRMGTEEDTTGQQRLTLWRYASYMVADRPFTGVGVGNFRIACWLYDSPIIADQHNIFIQAVSDLGVPGLFILLLLFYQAFSNNKKVRRILKGEDQDTFLWNLSLGLDVGLIGFAVAGFFLTVLFYPFFWVHLMICTALRDVVERKYGHIKKQN
jgi:O-antigen ligase